MSHLAEPGHVYEVHRGHYAIRADGELVIMECNELLLIVEGSAFQGVALRLDTSELVHVTLLDMGDEIPVYVRVWP